MIKQYTFDTPISIKDRTSCITLIKLENARPFGYDHKIVYKVTSLLKATDY